MKTKLKDYIDLIFADAPKCSKTTDLKEEMYQNLCDRYDDLIAEGKSEGVAYNISVAGIGDVSSIIESLREEYGDGKSDDEGGSNENYTPHYTAEEKEQIEKYRMKAGIMNAIAIALYILCWVPLVILSEISALGNIGNTIGIAIMMVMIAVATGLMCMKSAIKPSFMKNKDFDEDGNEREKRGRNGKTYKAKKRKNPLLSAIHSCIWALTMVVYFVVSFATGFWHITWIIFLISAAVDNVVEAIFELAGKKYL